MVEPVYGDGDTQHADAAPLVAAWRGAVDSETALAACIETLGIVPVPQRARDGWPTLHDLRAPGVTMVEAWKWGGSLVAAGRVFCGRVLGGADALAFTSPAIFTAFFALAPGADYTRVYMQGQISITAKAIADLLQTKGPMRVQQIRQGMRLHKRFLAHDVPAALVELERTLLIVAGGPELAAPWQAATPISARPPAQRSRWSRQIAQDLDLRVWELTARWAPPELLAAADRLREHPAVAQATLLAQARPLAPTASDAMIRQWLGWGMPAPPEETT